MFQLLKWLMIVRVSPSGVMLYAHVCLNTVDVTVEFYTLRFMSLQILFPYAVGLHPLHLHTHFLKLAFVSPAGIYCRASYHIEMYNGVPHLRPVLNCVLLFPAACQTFSSV